MQLELLIAAKAKEYLKTSTGGAHPQPLQNSAKAEPIDTREELAKAAGISHGTIQKAKIIAQVADEPTKHALRRGERPLHSLYQQATKQRRAAARETQYTQALDRIWEQLRTFCGLAGDIGEYPAHRILVGAPQDPVRDTAIRLSPMRVYEAAEVWARFEARAPLALHSPGLGVVLSMLGFVAGQQLRLRWFRPSSAGIGSVH